MTRLWRVFDVFVGKESLQESFFLGGIIWG